MPVRPYISILAVLMSNTGTASSTKQFVSNIDRTILVPWLLTGVKALRNMSVFHILVYLLGHEQFLHYQLTV